jgi:hypothetical protein
MFGVHRERDPNLINLESSVFSLMKEISEENDVLLNITPDPSFSDLGWCAPLSPEEAIRELLQMQKDGKI